ncbi:MAG: MBL fold metallo-hydrolase [Betaproteobacteria bacterium]|nr:MBL fold metallo-hydrolase [Betaproteobacteria bacterium]MDH3435644.1 MBL fold metallo-hydrolase [Betaproteobacteria bacterium]
MRLTFLGAAGEVTGSCFLVETGAARFLVDCGLFQGNRATQAKNRSRFAFDPRALDFVLLTHAHIDHSGLLPRLVARGFGGPIFATGATCDLLEVMLTDSAYIQERESERDRRAKGRRRISEEPPLYTIKDAERCLRQLVPVEYDAEVAPRPGVRACFRDAGHILGSAIIEIWVGEGAARRKLVCSGDIGQRLRPLVRDPTPIANADVLLVESTYGNRLHRSLSATLEELCHAVTDTLARKGGNVIVPSFAVGRTQDLIYLLADFYRKGQLPEMDIYVDSPLALKATSITLRHLAVLDADAAKLVRWLKGARGRPRIRFVQDIEESIGLHRVKRGAVIISASGMCEAGRIKHHLRHNLGRPECTIIISGFQAAGTLGRRLVDGAKEVRIFGIPVPVRAEIYTIGGLSAHADQEGLIDWLSRFERAPRTTYVVHGEADIAEQFAGVVRSRLKWRGVTVPQRGMSVNLS